jgi:hypothetical protein
MSDRRSDAFDRALEEARRMDGAADPDGSRPAGRPRLSAGVAFARAPGSGGEARFGLALDWTDEPPERQAPPRPPARDAGRRPADTPAEIAAELGLDAPFGPGELASRWRDFVWRNHPDRQPLEARERANTRVAIANALYQRARRGVPRPR